MQHTNTYISVLEHSTLEMHVARRYSNNRRNTKGDDEENAKRLGGGGGKTRAPPPKEGTYRNNGRPQTNLLQEPNTVQLVKEKTTSSF